MNAEKMNEGPVPRASGRHHERWIAPLVAAIVVLGVLGGVRWNRGPAWRETHGAVAEIEPGVALTAPAAGELAIGCAGYADLVAAPRTEFTAPTSPGRWIGRGIGTHLTRGELRLRTREKFVGRILAINAPQADVVATDGTFLVRASGDSTIVAVLSGTAHILVAHGAPVDVGAGERAATSGGPAIKSPLNHDDRASLERLSTM